MCIVKTIKYENATVNIHDDYIPKDPLKYKENLKYVYDTLNMIYKGKDCKDLFYTKQELEQIRKNGTHQFI